MQLTCQHCKRRVQLKQKYPYHAGFSNEGFLYCDKDSTVLTFNVYDPTFEKLAAGKLPWAPDFSDKEKRKVEKHLKPCPCGGRFSFENHGRCPSCAAPIAKPIGKSIHFFILSNRIDGDTARIWKLAVSSF